MNGGGAEFKMRVRKSSASATFCRTSVGTCCEGRSWSAELVQKDG